MKELLPLFERPSRYLGSEWGACVKTGPEVRCRVALAFPDFYEVGMSYVGQRLLYGAVNAHPDLAAERVFMPGLEVARLLAERQVPLATLESDTPLADCHILAFHLTHELCYTTVLAMLDLAGLPLHAAQRGEGHPLVIAGGGQTFSAEPMAPFFDAMVLGDGEEVLPAIAHAVAEGREQGVSRAELLDRLAGLAGVYIPAHFVEAGTPGSGLPPTPLHPERGAVRKAVVADLDAAPYPLEQVVPFPQAVHDRLAVEIARGCTRGCRFCNAGSLYRPVRERSLPKLAELIEGALAGTGFEEMSFMSLSTGDFSALDGLFSESFARCMAEQVALSLPSLRVGSISGRLMELISRIRRTGVTLAPEAGSQRLRDVINKGITEPELMEHVSRLFACGWTQVKLYFMIGLPTETDEDLAAIFELCRAVADKAPRGRRVQVSVGVSPFVPKPHTPFQWEPQTDPQETLRRISLLRGLFARDKRLKLRWPEVEISFLEGVFSRAGRELAPVVEAAWRKGCILDSWSDYFRFDLWQEAFAEASISMDSYLQARDPEGPLPWDHLRPGVSREFLLRERKRALEEKVTPDCRYGACAACGVCTHLGRPSELAEEGGEQPDLRPRLVRSTRDQAEGSQELSPETLAAAEEALKPQCPTAPTPPPEELTRKAGRFRLWYAKRGPAAWLSTLELGRVFERAMRRAGVRLTFSSGFNPRPLLSSGNALPVGVESLAEYVDLYTREEYSAGQVLTLLRDRFPKGIDPLQVEVLSMERRPLRPTLEVYEVRYTGGSEGAEPWRAAWQAFAAAESFVFLRSTKKGTREIEAKAFVRECRPHGAESEQPAFRFTCDWSPKPDGAASYVSPLALAQAVTPGLEPTELALLKLEQRVAG